MNFLNKIFCKHVWEVVTDTVTPHIVLTGVINGESVEHECKSKRMIILECTECGKLDKTVEKV